jgi:U3 small nucleolar RNA-associated protein 21
VQIKSLKELEQVPVTAVAVSLCGNFGVLGYATGTIAKFNMQSGRDKGFFTVDNKNGAESLHSAEVTGLAVDSLNKVLVSCSLDKTVKLWDFYRGKL